jgi:LacI family transcriptional regulator
LLVEDVNQRTMEERGLSVPSEYVQRGGFRFDGGHTAAQTLLRLPQAPTAILAANDMSAYGAMAAAAEMGLRVPEDVSFIGFDDDSHAALHRPSLTTFRQPVWEAPREALAAAVNMMRGERVP